MSEPNRHGMWYEATQNWRSVCWSFRQASTAQLLRRLASFHGSVIAGLPHACTSAANHNQLTRLRRSIDDTKRVTHIFQKGQIESPTCWVLLTTEPALDGFKQPAARGCRGWFRGWFRRFRPRISRICNSFDFDCLRLEFAVWPCYTYAHVVLHQCRLTHGAGQEAQQMAES